MFYKVTMGTNSPYRIAEESNGFLYLIGDVNRYTESDFVTCEPIDDPYPTVRYQDGRRAKIGDKVQSICLDYKGYVTDLYHPHGIWPQGRVRIHTGQLISAAGVYKI